MGAILPCNGAIHGTRDSRYNTRPKRRAVSLTVCASIMSDESNHSTEGTHARAGELLRDLAALRREFSRNAKVVLGNALAGAGLAPRDEFMVQVELLSRLIDRVEDLERRVATLEARPEPPPT